MLYKDKKIGVIYQSVTLKEYLDVGPQCLSFGEVDEVLLNFDYIETSTEVAKRFIKCWIDAGANVSVFIEPAWANTKSDIALPIEERIAAALNEIVKMGAHGIAVSEGTLNRYRYLGDWSLKWSIIGDATFGTLNYQAKVKTLVEDYEGKLIDTLIVPTDLNRDWNALEQIVKVFPSRVGVIVNEGCMFHCPFRSTRLSSINWGQGPAPCLSYCRDIINTEPWRKYASPWIRPEDIRRYMGIGISSFYLMGDMNDAESTMRIVQAYKQEMYDGYVEELMHWSSAMKQANHVLIENKRLNGFINNTKCEMHDCKSCGFCSKYVQGMEASQTV